MPGTINFDTKTITFNPLAAKEKTFERFLRFRLHQARHGDVSVLHTEGVLTTYLGEDHEITFKNSCTALEGDLLEIEYPASYGYFLFGEDGSGEWKYTTKTV